MKKILFILGTRPEGIKLAPLYLEMLKFPKDFDAKICSTGQHKEMLDQVFDFFDIKADYSLNIMRPNQTLATITEAALSGIDKVLDEFKPDVVIVQGDTTTAFVGALAAFYRSIKIAHVEAGLRTGDIHTPFPEEANRVMISRIADYHFSPTGISVSNLLNESVDPKLIYKVGNTVTDAILIASDIVRQDKTIGEVFQDIDFSKKVILITAHRRENLGEGMENISSAIKELSNRDDVEIIFPVHLNPRVRDVMYKKLGGTRNIHLCDPLNYAKLVWVMNKSYLVLTDSGGIQEEAPSLGKPVLVMRESTERPEGIEAGTASLVGTDKSLIVSKTNKLLDNTDEIYTKMAHAINPYGNGNCSKKIIDILKFSS